MPAPPAPRPVGIRTIIETRDGLSGYHLEEDRAITAWGADAPTYHRDVAPILQKNCQECHRPGKVAPFSLLHYTRARKRADDIAEVTQHRTCRPGMPRPPTVGRSGMHAC